MLTRPALLKVGAYWVCTSMPLQPFVLTYFDGLGYL